MRPSKTVIWIIGAIIGVIVVLLVFRAGMVVGYRQAEYSSQWQLSHRVIWHDASDDSGFLNDHGAIGVIVSVGTTGSGGLPASIVVQDTDDSADKTILISSSTAVLAAPVGTSSSSIMLRPGQNVAVIGAPDDQGRIIAGIIRLLPPPSSLPAPHS